MYTAAYIDDANIYRSTRELGWKIDYLKLFNLLKEKYKTDHIFIFTGYVHTFSDRYRRMEKIGYKIIFKEVIKINGKVRANCDVEMVLKIVRDVYDGLVNRVIIVTGDGDFISLINFLSEKSLLDRIISPSPRHCSLLIKKSRNKITFMDELKYSISKNEKAPGEDDTSQGSFS